MSKITYTCFHCKKEATFQPEEEEQVLLEMKVRSAQTYLVTCPHCGKENSITVEP